jgi:hypothetical protein
VRDSIIDTHLETSMNLSFLAIPTALALAARPALAQCDIATVTPYGGPGNPVTLTSSFPGQYPVIGGSFLLQSIGAEPSSIGALLMSCRPADIALPRRFCGRLLVDPACTRVFPYAGSPTWKFPIPPTTMPGTRVFLQSIHSKSAGGWELSNGIEAKAGFALWDLVFEIVDEPGSASRCGCINWRVRVTNVGNVTSPNVCAFTGINCSPGPGDYHCNLGLFDFTTPNLAPGASWVYDVNGPGCYFVACNAFTGTQYIKCEINYSAGCFDLCNAGNNNFDQEPITIL